MIQLFSDNIRNNKVLAYAGLFLALSGSLMHRTAQGVRDTQPGYEELKAWNELIEKIKPKQRFGLEKLIENAVQILESNDDAQSPLRLRVLKDPFLRSVMDSAYDKIVRDLTNSEIILRDYTKDNGKEIVVTKKSDTRARINGAFNHMPYHIEAYKDIVKRNNWFKKYTLLPFLTLAIEARETAGDCNLVSQANAAGCTQHMEKTAKEEGLIIDYWIDERKDPTKAIPATAYRIAKLSSMYTVETALAMYNAGKSKVNAAMKKANSNNFSIYNKYLPHETQKYVPEVIGLTRILIDPNEYGIKIKKPENQIACQTRHFVKEGETVYRITKRYKVKVVDIKKCNPSVISLTELPVNYPLKIPSNGA